MSNDEGMRSASPSDGSTSGKAGTVAHTAADQASGVASTAVDAGKGVAGDAASEVKAVASQAKEHAQQLVHQTRSELVDQAGAKSQQAASGLRTLSDQISALGQGRPDEAGPLRHYLEEAQGRVSSFADRLDQGGPQGLIDDVTAFARRRPAVFLAGAVGAGFMVGRLIRSGALSGSSNSGTSNGSQLQLSTPPTLAGMGAPALGTQVAGIPDLDPYAEPGLTPTSPAFGASVADAGVLP